MRWWILLDCSCGKAPAANDLPPVETHGSAQSKYPTVELPGDCNGIVWDASEHALYLTDDTHDQLGRWTDAAGFAVFAALPAAKRTALGGLVRMPDGSFATASMGFGTDGAVFQISPKGESRALDHLDPLRRRIGLASDGHGGLYESYFVVTDGKHTGGVAQLGADGVEHELIGSGLAKPVGLAATATMLYVTDQEAHTLYAWPLPAGPLRAVSRELPDADLLTLLPGGDLVTGGNDGAVVRITPAGVVTRIAEGFARVRGTAYDAAGKRLFVVDHVRASSHHQLHIVPLEP